MFKSNCNARIAIATIAAAASLLLAGVGSTAAQAVTPSDEPLNVTIESPMKVVSYDRQVAAAHGFEIRADAAGIEYSVPVGTAPTASARGARKASVAAAFPAGTTPGNCGTSFVHLTGTRAKPRMSTGFEVYTAVVFRKWGVKVSAPGVSYDYNMDGGPSGAAWSDFRTPKFVAGVTTARVNDGSFAQLIDGGNCASLNPSTSNLY